MGQAPALSVKALAIRVLAATTPVPTRERVGTQPAILVPAEIKRVRLKAHSPAGTAAGQANAIARPAG